MQLSFKEKLKNFLNEYILYIYIGFSMLLAILTFYTSDVEHIILYGWLPFFSIGVGFLTGLYTNQSTRLLTAESYKKYNQMLTQYGIKTSIITGLLALVSFGYSLFEPNLTKCIITTLLYNLAFVMIILTKYIKSSKKINLNKINMN